MTRSVRWRVRAAVLGVGTRVAVVIGTRTNTSTSMAAVLDIRTSMSVANSEHPCWTDIGFKLTSFKMFDEVNSCL